MAEKPKPKNFRVPVDSPEERWTANQENLSKSIKFLIKLAIKKWGENDVFDGLIEYGDVDFSKSKSLPRDFNQQSNHDEKIPTLKTMMKESKYGTVSKIEANQESNDDSESVSDIESNTEESKSSQNTNTITDNDNDDPIPTKNDMQSFFNNGL